MNAPATFTADLDHPERQYLDLLSDVMASGARRGDRTGTGTLGVFGRQIRFDLENGFPLLTTKRVHFKSVVLELIWFLKGLTNVRWLQERGCSIWDEWADADGELGPVYGKQWRSWAAPDGRVIDQIADVLRSIRHNPESRRHIVSAWNPGDVEDMALPPCHCLFQFYVADGRLSCQLYQRSADLFLGVPFNIASYALLTALMARAAGLRPGEFVHTLGDAHLYLNHIEQAMRQVAREPVAFPTLVLPDTFDLFDLDETTIKLRGYKPHPRDLGADRGLSITLTVGPVARARNGVIGMGGALPWRLKSDLAMFRELTMGKPIIMGRRTWDSLPKRPLPGRTNIVLSRDGRFEPRGAVACEDFQEAVQIGRDQAREDGAEEICIIGGASLFEVALPRAKRLYLTEVEAEPDGDVWFPPFSESEWTEVRRERHEAGPDDDFAFTLRVLERL